MEQLHYILGRILWYVLAPSHLLVLLLFIGLALTWLKRPLGRRITMAVAISLLIIVIAPVEHLLLAPLEQRIEQPAAIADIDSIIVLGGGQQRQLSHQFPYSGYGRHSGRMIAAVAIARQYSVPIIFAGGQLLQDNTSYPEAKSFEDILQLSDLKPEQVIINSESKDTYDNARFAKEITQQHGFKRSLLITSAAHMPRALGAFNRQKINIIPFPVEYQLVNSGRWFGFSTLVKKFYLIEYAAHEWLGLTKYYILGMSQNLLPTQPTKKS